MKTYRIYFNRWAEAPQIWSVDEGDQSSEINVINVVFKDIEGLTKYNPNGDNTNTPRAWFEVKGKLTISGGIAYITGKNNE